MNPDIFNSLDLERKGTLVFSKGKFLVSKEYHGFKLGVYQLNEMLAEVWYESKEKRIVDIKILELDDALDFYADQMQISDLFF